MCAAHNISYTEMWRACGCSARLITKNFDRLSWKVINNCIQNVTLLTILKLEQCGFTIVVSALSSIIQSVVFLNCKLEFFSTLFSKVKTWSDEIKICKKFENQIFSEYLLFYESHLEKIHKNVPQCVYILISISETQLVLKIEIVPLTTMKDSELAKKQAASTMVIPGIRNLSFLT